MSWLNKTKRGYIFDKRIFWLVIAFTVISVLYIFYQHSFDFTPDLYFNCNLAECKNPLYLADCRQQLTILFFIPLYTTGDCNDQPEYWWLQERYLPRGTYGEPPPNDFFYKNIRMLVVAVLILGLVFNHLIHNKGKKFDMEIRVSKKTRIIGTQLRGG